MRYNLLVDVADNVRDDLEMNEYSEKKKKRLNYAEGILQEKFRHTRFKNTGWIDEDVNYTQSNKGIIRMVGVTDVIRNLYLEYSEEMVISDKTMLS